jgi:hypothetical protein
MVGQRQRLWILHCSDAAVLQRVDLDHTTDTKRVSPAIALRRHNRRANSGIAENDACKQLFPSEPHPPHRKHILRAANVVYFDSQFHGSSIIQGMGGDRLAGPLRRRHGNVTEPTRMANYCRHADKSRQKEDDAHLQERRQSLLFIERLNRLATDSFARNEVPDWSRSG